MADNSVYHPFMLMDGDQPAMDFERAGYDSTLTAADVYEQGDLVYVDTSGNVVKAQGVGASMPKVALAGQDHTVDELLLPPNDGSSPHWFYQRGVPMNKIPEKHEFVFSLRGGSGGAASNGVDYAATAADLIDIQEHVQRELHFDTTEGCYVISNGTSNPNVEMLRVLRRGDVATDLNVLVVCRILPDFLRK